MEVDHIFICTKKKAPEGDLLVDFGLIEGSQNTHLGQGTANRRFYFQNMMVELLWIEDLTEVQNKRTKPMRLYERCLATVNKVCPFGVGFRPTIEKEGFVPFKTWDYHPAYLPEVLKIQVADGTPLSEPMYFYLSFANRKDTADKEREPMKHSIPLKEVTSVSVYINVEDDLSETAYILNDLGNVHIKKDKENLMVLEFDKGVLNQSKDFRPHLPLIFKW
ncbi:hypothetical protein [Cellulosilyticum sp. I15G10I2]|uniref:hypothetical protein n=1 Tax=Cellulosilyticum sp. I15G10I2 TaxID=1892843 RepID=UPI00085C278E|nr:hypothetical protein [Cellulosilyticum sp. I15G10I2]